MDNKIGNRGSHNGKTIHSTKHNKAKIRLKPLLKRKSQSKLKTNNEHSLDSIPASDLTSAISTDITSNTNPIASTSQKSVPATSKLQLNHKSKLNFKLNKKQIIYLVCGIIMAGSIAAITFVVLLVNHQTIDEETTFASNDVQTTISISTNDDTRVVYTYTGEDVTGMKTYFKYGSNEEAKVALDKRKSLPEFANAEVIDNYIVVTANPDDLKGLTSTDIRQQAETLEQYYGSKNTEGNGTAE